MRLPGTSGMPTRLLREKFGSTTFERSAARRRLPPKAAFISRAKLPAQMLRAPPEDYFRPGAYFPEDEASAVLQLAYDNGPLAHELAALFYACSVSKDRMKTKKYSDMNMWLPGDILLKSGQNVCPQPGAARVPFWTKGAGISPKTVPWITDQGTDTKTRMPRTQNAADEGKPPEKGFRCPIR